MNDELQAKLGQVLESVLGRGPAVAHFQLPGMCLLDAVIRSFHHTLVKQTLDYIVPSICFANSCYQCADQGNDMAHCIQNCKETLSS